MFDDLTGGLLPGLSQTQREVGMGCLNTALVDILTFKHRQNVQKTKQAIRQSFRYCNMCLLRIEIKYLFYVLKYKRFIWSV